MAILQISDHSYCRIGSKKEASEEVKLRCLDAKITMAEYLYERAVEAKRVETLAHLRDNRK